MRSSRVLAVDCGAGHVACGVFTLGSGGGLLLERFALETHNPDPALESRWPERIAQALAAIAAKEPLGGPCALIVPGHLALTKFVKTPAIEKAKRAKIIQFEASQNIPYPLDEVVWDYLEVANDGLDLEVMLAAAKRDAIEQICTAAVSAGFAVERALPSSLALRQGYGLAVPASSGASLVVNIGARSTNLLFVEEGRFYARTLALGGNAVSQAIADELRLEFAQAEALKIQVLSGRSDLPGASPSRASVQRAVLSFAGRLHLEITRSTVNFLRSGGAAQPACIYLTGGGSLAPELPTALADKLKLRVERYTPLRGIELAPAAADAADVAHLLADLVGPAARLIDRTSPEVSLLPPTLGAALAFRRRQPVILAAAALGVAALLPPIWYFHQRAEAATAQAREITDQLMPLRLINTRNSDNLAKIEEAKKQITAIQSLVETKSNWINFFTDLQTRLVKVEDVWLEKLAVDRAPLPDPGAQPETPPAADTNTPAPADGSAPAAAAPTAPPLRLKLSGRLLDRQNPVSKVSPESYEHVKRLLADFTGSQFISAVENERFDNTQPGILHFDFTLVVNPKKPL